MINQETNSNARSANEIQVGIMGHTGQTKTGTYHIIDTNIENQSINQVNLCRTCKVLRHLIMHHNNNWLISDT